MHFFSNCRLVRKMLLNKQEYMSLSIILIVVYSQVRLFTIAIQGDTCTKNSVDLKHISTVAVNNSERYNNATNDAAKDTEAMKIIFTDSELQVVETELSKYLEPEKVQRALTFYRGFQKHASQQELESSTVSDRILGSTFQSPHLF